MIIELTDKRIDLHELSFNTPLIIQKKNLCLKIKLNLPLIIKEHIHRLEFHLELSTTLCKIPVPDMGSRKLKLNFSKIRYTKHVF